MNADTLAWLLEVAKTTCVKLESDNKTLSDENERMKNSLRSIKRESIGRDVNTFHNVQVAISWIDNLL